jgi:RNA polymerase sigma factor for flagellar operon FliA
MTDVITGGAAAGLDGVVLPGGMDLPPELMSEMCRMVRAVAGKLHSRLPPGSGIEISDLIQAGNVGLLKAAKAFEPNMGAPLGGYAKFRIRGEMLDMIRRHAGRDRQPSTFSTPHLEGGDWDSPFQSPSEQSPQNSVLRDQQVSIIAEELRRLPARYLAVVKMRYAKGLTLREIGDSLHVNESRACQIHQGALTRLKRALWNRGVRDFKHL